MKIQERKSVFETNSSSTHSLTLTTPSIFDKWVHGELKFKSSSRSFESNDKSDEMNTVELGKINKQSKHPMDIEQFKKNYPTFAYLSYNEFCNLTEDEIECEFTIHNVDGKDIVSILIEAYEN